MISHLRAPIAGSCQETSADSHCGKRMGDNSLCPPEIATRDERVTSPKGELTAFRRLIGRGAIGDRLHEDSIAEMFKRVAAWIGMSAKQVRRVSGHWVRVGATQDLLALNIDLASVMQAGRRKSTRMPMRHGEETLAARGGMARAAEAQGRDDAGQ